MSVIALPPMRVFRLIAAALLLIATGCAAPPDTERGAYTSEEKGIQSAQEAMELARQSDSPARDRYLIEAARLFLEADNPESAEQALRQVNRRFLNTELQADYTLAYARLALSQDRFFRARELLTDKGLERQASRLTKTQQRRWHRLRADLFALLGEEQRAVKEYVALSRLLSEREELRTVHNAIWQTLSRISQKTLDERALATTDRTLRGWYQLALLGRESLGDIGQQVARINDWRDDNPNHPAARVPPDSLRRAATASTAVPQKLAVLLPFGGDYQAAAKTLRDGFLAAYFDAAGDGHAPEIRFYDTSRENDTVATYQRAVAEGAQLVVGPLRKERLRQLMEQPSLPVPVLALNYLEDSANPHGNLYQFGLASADEARQIVERTWLAGHRAALAIHPNAKWAQDAFGEFTEQWQDRDGSIVDASYEQGRADYSAVLAPALLIPQSEERAERLERTLGKNLEFTPRRRQDLDMVLLLARAQHGRQIKPTLDFLYAADLPVYSTSHIYTGTPDPAQDQDLDGVLFSAMPWYLPSLVERTLQPGEDMAPAYRDLFAMGGDAYRLHQWLDLMRALPDVELQGQTGTLAMAPANRIRRRLPWAVFRNGRVEPAPALSDEQ